MDAIIKDKTLRLPIPKVNPETLDKFDGKIIAQRQNRVALLITSLFRIAVGSDSVDDNVSDSAKRDCGVWRLSIARKGVDITKSKPGAGSH